MLLYPKLYIFKTLQNLASTNHYLWAELSKDWYPGLTHKKLSTEHFKTWFTHAAHSWIAPALSSHRCCKTALSTKEISVLWVADKWKAWRSDLTDRFTRHWMMLYEQNKFNFWRLLIPGKEKDLKKGFSHLTTNICLWAPPVLHCYLFPSVMPSANKCSISAMLDDSLGLTVTWFLDIKIQGIFFLCLCHVLCLTNTFFM